MALTEDKRRLEAFEKMLACVQGQYEDTVRKMAELKKAGREKSATYRQLMGSRLQLRDILARYQVYGLTDSNGTEERTS